MSERDVSLTLVDDEEEIRDHDRTKDLRLKYTELLDRYPLTTKCCTSAMIGAMGAMIVEMSTNRHSTRGKLERYGGVRWLDLLAHAICGAVQGPLGHYW